VTLASSSWPAPAPTSLAAKPTEPSSPPAVGGLPSPILKFWDLTSIDQLIEFANTQPAPDFSRLTQLVLDHANAGDPIAASVLRREGEDLAWLVRLVVRQLPQNPLPRIAFTGSILEKIQPVRDALIANVRIEFPAIIAMEGVVDPLAGALWRARSGSHFYRASPDIMAP
jgi:glucosamine kinase